MKSKVKQVEQVLNRLRINHVKVRLHIIGDIEHVALIWAGGYTYQDMKCLIAVMVPGIKLVYFRKS